MPYRTKLSQKTLDMLKIHKIYPQAHIANQSLVFDVEIDNAPRIRKQNEYVC